MKLVVRGRCVHYELAGPPEAAHVLFVHSLGTDRDVWMAQAAALSARWRCVRYDLPGHGLSDGGPADFGLDDLCADAAALLEAVGARRAHVCGLSLGGLVAQRLASIAPARVDRLALVGTALRIGEPRAWHQRAAAVRSVGLEAMASDLLARWFAPGFRERCPQAWSRLRDGLSRTAREAYAAACTLLAEADLSRDAGAIRAATLVVVGEHDVATPVPTAEALRAAIGDARLAVVPGAGHILTVERPSELTRLLEDHFHEG